MVSRLGRALLCCRPRWTARALRPCSLSPNLFSLSPPPLSLHPLSLFPPLFSPHPLSVFPLPLSLYPLSVFPPPLSPHPLSPFPAPHRRLHGFTCLALLLNTPPLPLTALPRGKLHAEGRKAGEARGDEEGERERGELRPGKWRRDRTCSSHAGSYSELSSSSAPAPQTPALPCLQTRREKPAS